MSAAPGQPPRRDPQEPARDPRRRLAGIGFSLIGAYFAVTSFQLEAGLWLRVLLVLVGLAVLGYGIAQLVRPRR